MSAACLERSYVDDVVQGCMYKCLDQDRFWVRGDTHRQCPIRVRAYTLEASSVSITKSTDEGVGYRHVLLGSSIAQ